MQQSRVGDEAGGHGKPAPIVAAAAAEAVIALAPTPSRSRCFAPTPRWPKAWAGRRRCRSSPASCSSAAPQARDGGRAQARRLGQVRGAQLTHGRRSPRSTWPRTCRAGRPGSRTPRQNCAPGERRARSRRCSPTTRSPPRRRSRVSAIAPGGGCSTAWCRLGAARELTGRAAFRLYGL